MAAILSCDIDHLYKLSFSLPKEAPHEFWHWFAKWFQRRRCLKVMVIYMYIAPGQGQATSLGSFVFFLFFFFVLFVQKCNSSVNLVICFKFYPLNDFVTVFPFKPICVKIWPWHKIGQGQPRVTIHKKNFVELESPMLHAKFQDHRTSGSREEGFYHIWAWRPSWSCDMDHLYKLWFPLPKDALHKIGFDWPSGFGEEES